ncbi:hypothetical protein AAMO2058_000441400 [Amorphochlora amoebiformis]|mmetsp:Transcript_12203/g.19328  ORF Transcript_12203/g.19328 Transcript_12203/m.19328 type:complete len:209 (-) Transcript_12203:52-678(-)
MGEIFIRSSVGVVLSVGFLVVGTVCGSYLVPTVARRAITMVIRWVKGSFSKKKFNYDNVGEGLYLGRQPSSVDELDEIQKLGVSYIVSVLETWEFNVPVHNYRSRFEWLHIIAMDFCAPTDEDLVAAVAFINRARGEGKGVYVHCNSGVGRGATVVAAYLLTKTKNPDLDAVVSTLREMRPRVSKSLTRWPWSQQARTLWRFAGRVSE